MALANGTPPEWVRPSAEARLWALVQVHLHVCPWPWITTDCHGIIDALKHGKSVATGPKSMLARCLGHIRMMTDGRGWHHHRGKDGGAVTIKEADEDYQGAS